MSFSLQVKQEILDNKPMRARYRQAQAYGLFLLGRAFTPQEISLHTENQETAELFRQFCGDLLGRPVSVSPGRRTRGGKTVYAVALEGDTDRLALLAHFGHRGGIRRELLPTPEHLGAFLAGAFLAGGNIADPEKSYHLEFLVRDAGVCEALAGLLDEVTPGAGISARRGVHLVYYKECAAIEDLLTRMGATKGCLRMIDIELYKNIRNRANRTVNCETANIDKLVGAATDQVEAIRLIFEKRGEDSLPEGLRQAARLRLAHPDASLRELAELSPLPISRSGMHHRLERLSKIAAGLRQEGDTP